ncbi:hypothetical protein ABAC460_06005 [Asticcacaulis sp. AC460]|uniref:vWA domain-containing protein n=1 Tax=Asticcacaulis sp. AC460 TaxID=1282360 RepID=UPI0003C3B302|nr:VWA-like domain-containing protein [Asticcacaulis sp. AC460]ESQ91536.1 hypothetical protein ABAC460_06005 [Asticcacaulis sp. AC460]
MAKKLKGPPDDNMRAISAGYDLLSGHPLFARLEWVYVIQTTGESLTGEAFARLRSAADKHSWTAWSEGEVYYTVEVNPWKRLTPAEWANVMAQAVLHHYFCHAASSRTGSVHDLACAVMAYDFLCAIGVGQRPQALTPPEAPRLGHDLTTVTQRLRDGGADLVARYACLGINGRGNSPFYFVGAVPAVTAQVRRQREDALAISIRASVVKAIDDAGETVRGPATKTRNPNSLAERARSWFVANFPLLAALASGFEIVEDEELCQSLDIAIAAVDAELGRVYINPKRPWSYEGMKFVIAHELLHVGLRHEPRRQGRDPWLWNVACDYVINGWLVEMGVGEMPDDGLLLDPELMFEKESAEAIYDRITRDLRLVRRLAKTATFRGRGVPDMIGSRPPAWWNGPGCDLDDFYRRALSQGLDLHLAHGERGLLPGDMVEEIRALQQKPIPWDVRLGQWLDAFFPPPEARRSFARASRRQASTPDIARPVWMRPDDLMASRTFGVVLDTSGSMSARVLAKALGAIASYALSREVLRVRVIECDGGIHDMGYVAPESLLGRVEVRGRGGTVLQPGITRLEMDRDFPKDAPVLVITDGYCDALSLKREHAFLMPEGARVPFSNRAPRFAFERE